MFKKEKIEFTKDIETIYNLVIAESFAYYKDIKTNKTRYKKYF